MYLSAVLRQAAAGTAGEGEASAASTPGEQLSKYTVRDISACCFEPVLLRAEAHK